MLARIRKSMKEKDQGFTLIELLVVMIIIGILAAVAIPVFLNQKKKAVDSSIKSDVVNIAQQIESNAVDTQTYPAADRYKDVTAGTASGDQIQIPGVQITSGNLIRYKAITDGFCVAGSNPNSDAPGDSNGTWFWYSSTKGGLFKDFSQGPPSNSNC